MTGILTDRRKESHIVYTLTASKAGRDVFSDITLPDGTVIRRVDESVHRKALENVNRRYLETLNAG